MYEKIQIKMNMKVNNEAKHLNRNMNLKRYTERNYSVNRLRPYFCKKTSLKNLKVENLLLRNY